MPPYEEFSETAEYYFTGKFKIGILIQCPDCEGLGESNFGDGICPTCGGEGDVTRDYAIPWSAIKKIYRYAVDFYTLHNFLVDLWREAF